MSSVYKGTKIIANVCNDMETKIDIIVRVALQSLRLQSHFPMHAHGKSAELTNSYTHYIPLFTFFQITILITNGKSDDVIDGPAKAVRDSGISLFAVGKSIIHHHHAT